MARQLNKLSQLKVKAIKEKGTCHDGGGLYLCVAESGAKSWRLFYTLNGKSREMGLGSFEAVSLADGQVLITAVDSPYYHGAFQFDEAAVAAGFSKPDTYSFDPSKLPGYTHTNTNNTDSAIDGHDKFRTWVFSLKKGFY